MLGGLERVNRNLLLLLGLQRRLRDLLGTSLLFGDPRFDVRLLGRRHHGGLGGPRRLRRRLGRGAVSGLGSRLLPGLGEVWLARPRRWPERLIRELLQLGLGGAAPSLQLEVRANRFVEDSHSRVDRKGYCA